jgi:hypothetical protein
VAVSFSQLFPKNIFRTVYVFILTIMDLVTQGICEQRIVHKDTFATGGTADGKAGH